MASIRRFSFVLATPFFLSGQAYFVDVCGRRLAEQYSGISADLQGTGGPQPQAVAVDPAGNVFFADANCVLRLDASTGILTVAASNGTGFNGDNQTATSAERNGL